MSSLPRPVLSACVPAHTRALAASPQHAIRAGCFGTPPASTVAATGPLLPLARRPPPVRYLARPLTHKEANNTTPSHLLPRRLPRASLLLSTPLVLCAALLLRACAHPANHVAPTHVSALTSPLRCSSSTRRLLSSGKPYRVALTSAALPS
jgi:hypothetical protein